MSAAVVAGLRSNPADCKTGERHACPHGSCNPSGVPHLVECAPNFNGNSL